VKQSIGFVNAMNGPNGALIRRATPLEIEALASLAARIWRECYRDIISNAQIDYMLDRRFRQEALLRALTDEQNPHWLLYLDEALVGYGSQSLASNAGRLKIEQVYLDSRSRGAGLGRELLEHMAATARRAKGTAIFLTVNKNNRNAIRFYERQGFAISGSCMTDIGHGFVMDDYVMERAVS